MVNNVAVLEFSTLDPKKTHIVKITDVRSDVTQAEMEAVMDYVVAKQLFYTPDGAITGKVSCKLQKQEVEEIEF